MRGAHLLTEIGAILGGQRKPCDSRLDFCDDVIGIALPQLDRKGKRPLLVDSVDPHRRFVVFHPGQLQRRHWSERSSLHAYCAQRLQRTAKALVIAYADVVLATGAQHTAGDAALYSQANRVRQIFGSESGPLQLLSIYNQHPLRSRGLIMEDNLADASDASRSIGQGANNFVQNLQLFSKNVDLDLPQRLALLRRREEDCGWIGGAD